MRRLFLTLALLALTSTLLAHRLESVPFQGPVTPTRSVLGDWVADYTGTGKDRPTEIGTITFSIRATGQGYAAQAQTAHTDKRDLAVTDLQVDGNKISFRIQTEKSWGGGDNAGHYYHHCCTTLVVEGTVDGEAIRMTMAFQSSDMPDDPNPKRYPMEARRVPR